MDIKWRKRYGERDKSLRDTNKREKQREREREREIERKGDKEREKDIYRKGRKGDWRYKLHTLPKFSKDDNGHFQDLSHRVPNPLPHILFLQKRFLS